MTARLFRRGIVYVLLAIAAFVCVFPFYWMLVGATNTSTDIVAGRILPGANLLANIAALFALIDMPRILFNSVLLAVIGTALTLVVSSLAGYGFEMFRSRLRDRLFNALLLLLSIPFAAIMVPLFTMVGQAHITNTFAAVLLPGIASIFIIFYFRQATKAFPSELRDAARIDGLKEWQVFLHIYIPVMRPTYAAAIIILFMANWNSYLWPLIVLQGNENKTITLIVSALTTTYTVDYGMIMLATVIATLPTLVIFFALQRLFVEGLLGSVK